MVQIKFSDITKIPNLISLIRLLLIVPILLLINYTTQIEQIVLFCISILAILSDFLDGILSRKFDCVTDLGKLLDPFVDKIALGMVSIFLVYCKGFPQTLALIIIFRDVLIICISLFVILTTTTITVPNYLGKLNTLIISITCFFYTFNITGYCLTILVLTAYVTVSLSGLIYLLRFLRTYRKKIFVKSLVSIITFVGIILIFFLSSISSYDLVKKNNSIPVYSFQAKDSLIQKYSPILFLAEKETYEPININFFLRNSILMKNSGFLLFDHQSVIPLNKLKSNKYTYGDYYLKLNRRLFDSIKGFYISKRKNISPTIYVNAYKINSDTVECYIIQYWFFFLASDINLIDIVWHECDWEMVMILFDSELNPTKIGFSQHYYGSVFNYTDLDVVNDHPKIFIAKGSHSPYPSAGKHTTFIESEKKLPLGWDLCTNGRMISPEDYNLILLDSTNYWLDFKGYWGIPITTKLLGPKYRSPSTIDYSMWQNPINWFTKYSSRKIFE